MTTHPEGKACVVTSEVALSPTVRGLRLRALQGALCWTPGQYVRLRPHEGARDHVAASIVNSASVGGDMELALGRAARGVLGETTAVWLEGPFGEFSGGLVPERPVLFVAAGTGVGPLRSMIQLELELGHAPAPRVLLFGARHQDDLLWEAEFRELERRARWFRYVPTLTRPDPGWHGAVGRVQPHLAPLLRELREAEAYVCGSTEMVRSSVEQLVSSGLDERRIHTQRHTALRRPPLSA